MFTYLPNKTDLYNLLQYQSTRFVCWICSIKVSPSLIHCERIVIIWRNPSRSHLHKHGDRLTPGLRAAPVPRPAHTFITQNHIKLAVNGSRNKLCHIKQNKVSERRGVLLRSHVDLCKYTFQNNSEEWKGCVFALWSPLFLNYTPHSWYISKPHGPCAPWYI